MTSSQEVERFSTPEARTNAGINALKVFADVLTNNTYLLQITGIMETQETARLSPASNLLNEFHQQDLKGFQTGIRCAENLSNLGNRQATIQADILTRHLAKLVVDNFGNSSPKHKVVFSSTPDDLDQRYKQTVDDLRAVEQSTLEHNPVALTVSTETVGKLASLVTINTDDNFSIALPTNIATGGQESIPGKVIVGKNQITATFSLPDLASPNRNSPLAQLAGNNSIMALRNEVVRTINNRFGYFNEKENIITSLISLNSKLLLTEIVSALVRPQSIRDKAIWVYHGLAVEDAVSEQDRKAIFQDMLATMTNIVNEQSDKDASLTEAVIDKKTMPVMVVRTKHATYRAFIKFVRGKSQLTISSMPLEDKYRNTKERIADGLQATNDILQAIITYLDAPVATPGILMLSPEIERASKIDLVELGGEELSEDLAQIGGLPRVTQQAIDNFVRGTIAYRNEEQDIKPYNLMLQGETGSGKSTVALAIAKEFKRYGIPSYKIATTERITPANIVKALLTFSENEGGVLIIDDVEDYFKGKGQEVQEARSSLLQILSEINRSASHLLIFTTEHPERVMGEREALLQTHRMDTVPCSLELSPEAIEDVLRAIVARLLTVDPENPVLKADQAVDALLTSLCKGSPFETWITNLLAIGQEYSDSASLSPGVFVGAFKAAGNLREATTDDIEKQLLRILNEKAIHRVQAQQNEQGGELRDLTERFEELFQLVNGQTGKIAAQEKTIAELKKMIQKVERNLTTAQSSPDTNVQQTPSRRTRLGPRT